MRSFFQSHYLHIKRKFLSPLIAILGQWLLKGILKTCRIHIQGIEHFFDTAVKDRCMLMFWHNKISIIPYFLKKHAPQFQYGAVISKSRDGDLLQTIVNTHPTAKTIRVPHNARHQALREMVQQLKQKTVILITPDGPRGPRYWVKPGIAYAAQATKSKIIPLTWSASHFWQLNSWDRMVIPKPFSKIIIHIGSPITITTTDNQDFDKEARKLKKILKNLDHQAWTKITPETKRWPK